MSGLKLFEIDSMLRDALDAADEKINHDTGEIPDDWADFLNDVQMERDKKCLGLGAYIRECMAESDVIKSEVKRLAARARVCENKAERAKKYLSSVVAPGEKLKDNSVSIGWRKSTAVVIDDENVLPETCFRIIKEVSKTYVKEQIESGVVTTGAHIEERQNIQIR